MGNCWHRGATSLGCNHGVLRSLIPQRLKYNCWNLSLKPHHWKFISICHAGIPPESTENVGGNKGQVTVVFIKVSAGWPDRQPSLGFHRHKILYLMALHESFLSGCFTEHILCLSAAKSFGVLIVIIIISLRTEGPWSQVFTYRSLSRKTEASWFLDKSGLPGPVTPCWP